MKRNMELIRAILFELEEDRLSFTSEPIQEWNAEEVAYHRGLILDADLAEGKNLSTLGDEDYSLSGLTSKGHDFVDAARNQTVWASVKSKVLKVGGSVSLSVFQELLKKSLLQELGL